MSEEEHQVIEIRIEFERSSGDPTRIFHSMAGLIEAIQSIDSHLGACIGIGLRTSLLLEDVEAASLKAKLKTTIEAIPDDALKSGDIKKLIGHYLLKGKHRILDWCNDRQEISTREEVKQLEDDIYKLAANTDVKGIPAYTAISTATLLADIVEIKAALNYLGGRDRATLKSQVGLSHYNNDLVVSEGMVREIITRETLKSTGERIVKVKKPDYLGQSRWVFKYSDRMIEAKIADQDWLLKFHSKEVHLLPGDSLKVLLREEVSYGYDSEVIYTEYEVMEVLDVIRGLREQQQTMI